MRRTLARSRAVLFLLIATLLLSPALVATSADAAGKTRYRVGIKLSDTHVVVREAVRVSGSVRPLTKGRVVLQRRISGKWRTLKKTKLVASSYAVQVRFAEPGVAFLRVVAPASRGKRRGVSKTRTVRVVANAHNPQIVTASLPDGRVGAAYSATVANADGRPGQWSIETGELPPGLTIEPATGEISGTPTTVGTSQFGVYFRDYDGRVAARGYQIAISSDGPTSPVISTTSLPDAELGEAYTATLETSDNRAGTWTITAGELPPGLTLAAATGVISGIPTTVGTSGFTVQFKDAAELTATKQLSIVVAGDNLIVTTSLPDGVKGTAYTATLKSKDDRAGTWSISAGSLPAGLGLNDATGVISGTPTAPGKVDFTVRFQDGAGAASTRALSITVANTPPEIATTTLPKGTVDEPYTATLMTVDNRAGTWSISDGTLPAGLSLAPTTGVISGTPTTRATSNFTVGVQGRGGCRGDQAALDHGPALRLGNLLLLRPTACAGPPIRAGAGGSSGASPRAS